MMVATLQESGDQYLFGADDEDEEYNRDYGEDKDQLISQFWDDADVENAPVVSSDELAMLDEAAFQQEVTRLQEMKVLRKVKRHDLASNFQELSTTAVQDWRHRGGHGSDDESTAGQTRQGMISLQHQRRPARRSF